MTELTQQSDLLKEEYVKLLNDKDVLINWGKPQLEALYLIRIGRFQIEKLQIQLRIKALKRKNEMIRSALNAGKEVDLLEIGLQVAMELTVAEAKIFEETAKLESAKGLLNHLDTPERCAELRKLYKQLAKKLHPDVNHDMSADLIELWHLVKNAYESGDLDKLKAISIVYDNELNRSESAPPTEEQLLLQIALMKEGIRLLQEEIRIIRNEFPFNIEQQIKDDDWVIGEQEKMEAEFIKLKEYEVELEEQYQQLICII